MRFTRRLPDGATLAQVTIAAPRASARAIGTDELWRYARVERRTRGGLGGKYRPGRREYEAVISPDGSRLAFASNRSGSDEIWVSNRDGANLVQLTTSPNPDGTGWPSWSPDGARIAYQARARGAGDTDVFVIPSAGGAAVRITGAPDADTRPSWSVDGRWIYFTSLSAGGNSAWKAPAAGGEAVRVSTAPATFYQESADGRWLYGGRAQSLVRIPLAGGEPEELGPYPMAVAALTSRGIYYLSDATDLQSATLTLLPLDGSTPRALGTIPHSVSAGLSIAPDFTSIVYSRCDQCAADIMLVDGFP